MARPDRSQHATSVERRREQLVVPAELTLRFGADRLPARLCWRATRSVPGGSPLVLLLAAAQDATEADAFSGRLCSLAGAVVLSIPSSNDPAEVADHRERLEVAVLGWAAEDARDLGADPRLLSVAGLRAATASAVRLALVARDQGWPGLRRQLLVDPEPGSARFSPQVVIGLPPAVIVSTTSSGDHTAGYAAQLRTAGIDIEQLRYRGDRPTDATPWRELARLLRAERVHPGRQQSSSATPLDARPAQSGRPVVQDAQQRVSRSDFPSRHSPAELSNPQPSDPQRNE